MAFNTQKPVLMLEGGLGSSTATVSFAPVCTGDNTQGTLQVAAEDMSNVGYVLTSTGSGSLPTWQAATAGDGVIVTEYTTPGAGTHTFDAGTTVIDVLCISGGQGGASGRRGDTTATGGGGGGAGGLVIWYTGIARDAFGADASYEVGAGGLGGAAQTVDDTDGNAGNAGGTTFFGAILAPSIYGAKAVAVGGTTSSAAGGQSLDGIWNNSTFATPAAGQGLNVTGGNANDPSLVINPSVGSGGGGGGVDTNVAADGGRGSQVADRAGTIIIAGGTGGTAPGGNGGAGADVFGVAYETFSFGTGGGGGAGNNAGAGGNGGAGGYPGGGGGGGGAGFNGNNSGAGGDGADGYIRIIEYT